MYISSSKDDVKLSKEEASQYVTSIMDRAAKGLVNDRWEWKRYAKHHKGMDWKTREAVGADDFQLWKDANDTFKAKVIQVAGKAMFDDMVANFPMNKNLLQAKDNITRARCEEAIRKAIQENVALHEAGKSSREDYQNRVLKQPEPETKPEEATGTVRIDIGHTNENAPSMAKYASHVVDQMDAALVKAFAPELDISDFVPEKREDIELYKSHGIVPDGYLDRKMVSDICPGCAEEMKKAGMIFIREERFINDIGSRVAADISSNAEAWAQAILETAPELVEDFAKAEGAEEYDLTKANGQYKCKDCGAPATKELTMDDGGKVYACNMCARKRKRKGQVKDNCELKRSEFDWDLLKAGRKDISKLQKKTITDKRGRTQTVYVNPEAELEARYAKREKAVIEHAVATVKSKVSSVKQSVSSGDYKTARKLLGEARWAATHLPEGYKDKAVIEASLAKLEKEVAAKEPKDPQKRDKAAEYATAAVKRDIATKKGETLDPTMARVENFIDLVKAKGKKDVTKLTKKTITNKAGHRQTVYVKQKLPERAFSAGPGGSGIEDMPQGSSMTISGVKVSYGHDNVYTVSSGGTTVRVDKASEARRWVNRMAGGVSSSEVKANEERMRATYKEAKPTRRTPDKQGEIYARLQKLGPNAMVRYGDYTIEKTKFSDNYILRYKGKGITRPGVQSLTPGSGWTAAGAAEMVAKDGASKMSPEAKSASKKIEAMAQQTAQKMKQVGRPKTKKEESQALSKFKEYTQRRREQMFGEKPKEEPKKAASQKQKAAQSKKKTGGIGGKSPTSPVKSKKKVSVKKEKAATERKAKTQKVKAATTEKAQAQSAKKKHVANKPPKAVTSGGTFKPGKYKAGVLEVGMHIEHTFLGVTYSGRVSKIGKTTPGVVDVVVGGRKLMLSPLMKVKVTKSDDPIPIIGEQLDLIDFIKANSSQAIEGWAKKMKAEGGEHPFAWCTKKAKDFASDPNAFCAAVHLSAYGKTPSQRKAEKKK